MQLEAAGCYQNENAPEIEIYWYIYSITDQFFFFQEDSSLFSLILRQLFSCSGVAAKPEPKPSPYAMHAIPLEQTVQGPVVAGALTQSRITFCEIKRLVLLFLAAFCKFKCIFD